MDKEKYLVIGAGPSGLAMAKSLKTMEIPYNHVEADNDVGGNWYHGAYDTANLLSSKDVTEFPDYPMPDSYPDFPSRRQMYDYYVSYTDHYQLRANIQFNKKVVFVRPVENNLWEVIFEDGTQTVYKGVIICNGHHWSKRYPEFEGEFNGESFHSKDYKSPDQLRGKKILIVGAGNSAFDIASESARVGKEAYMSVRRGIWIFPKIFMGKTLSTFRLGLPKFMMKTIAKLMLKIAIGDPQRYGFPKPTIDIFDRHPTIDTDTLINIRNGKIKVKGGVKKLHENHVEFEDGSSVEVDTIVYATGFNVDFPFLPKELKRVEGSVVKVYAYSMFDDYKGLFMIGWFQPRGGIGSLVAPYCDLVAQLIKAQDKFGTPVGAVFRELGEVLPDTHLFGGKDLIQWVNKRSRQMNKIERIGLKLDEKNKGFRNKVLTEEVPAQADKMIVY